MSIHNVCFQLRELAGFSLRQGLASKSKMESEQQRISTIVFMFDCWDCGFSLTIGVDGVSVFVYFSMFFVVSFLTKLTKVEILPDYLHTRDSHSVIYLQSNLCLIQKVLKVLTARIRGKESIHTLRN